MSKNEDRGMMKWNAFHSVLSEDEVNSSILTNDTVEKPELSEDQIEELERLIIEAFNNKKEIRLTTYKNGKLIEEVGLITKLDPLHKAIYLNKKMVLFSDILKIEPIYD